MEKRRYSKIIAVVALVLAVVGLTLGFAAFSNTLTISSSAAVNPSAETFKVQFSSSESALETNGVTGVATGGATAGTATVTGTTVSNLTAGFTAPGQTVSYTFYTHNTGEYEAFLNSITFANVTDQNAAKICAAVDTTKTTASLVSAACEDISVSVTAGATTADGSLADISGHSLVAKTGKETVTVTITYAANGDRADGDFNVSFGDVSLVYDTAD